MILGDPVEGSFDSQIQSHWIKCLVPVLFLHPGLWILKVLWTIFMVLIASSGSWAPCLSKSPLVNFERCFTLWEFVGSIKTPECTHLLEKLATVTPKRHLVTCLNTSLSHFWSQNESSAAGSLSFSAAFFVLSLLAFSLRWLPDLKGPSCSFLSAGDYRCTALSPAPPVPLSGPRTSLLVSNAPLYAWVCSEHL